MPPRATRKRLEDILLSITRIEESISGLSPSEVLNNHDKVQALELNLIHIGEAVANVPDRLLDQYTEVAWREVVAMRNRMAHVYWDVDTRIL